MLAVHELAYRYRDSPAPALAGVSLNAAHGRVLGLLGPNGAGKTTLIAHLAGLLPVVAGCIEYDGRPLADLRRSDPTRIALAPQEYAFYPSLSVAENLTCFAAANRLHGRRAAQAVADCIAFSQLESHRRVRAERLSGGLKRRLNLAIALLAEPAVLLLDEPTVGVDPQSRAFLLDAVRDLSRRGTAVIYTSHYMEEIEAIADDVVIIDQGRVLCQGTLADLLADGHGTVELRLRGGPCATARAVIARYGTARGLDANRLVVDLASECHPATLLGALAAAGLVVEEARFGRRNLEQLFMQLTDRHLRDA